MINSDTFNQGNLSLDPLPDNICNVDVLDICTFKEKHSVSTAPFCAFNSFVPSSAALGVELARAGQVRLLWPDSAITYVPQLSSLQWLDKDVRRL